MAFWQADETSDIAVDGGTIWYRRNRARDAQAKTPLLVIHGGPGSSHDYLLPCVRLAQTRDVILYDQLDCGRSHHTNRPELWNLPHFAAEINAIKEALQLDQFHILASSWGATIALYYAAHLPSKGLSSLILSGPLVSSQRWMEDNEIWRQQLPRDILQTLQFHEAHEDYDHQAYREATSYFYRRHLCRKIPWPDYVLHAMNNANNALYRTMWGPTEFLCTGSLKDLDLTPSLGKINVPTLFISGEFDEGTFAANEFFATLLPQAHARMIADSSHMPHIEQPEIFFPLVEIFLQTVETGHVA